MVGLNSNGGELVEAHETALGALIAQRLRELGKNQSWLGKSLIGGDGYSGRSLVNQIVLGRRSCPKRRIGNLASLLQCEEATLHEAIQQDRKNPQFLPRGRKSARPFDPIEQLAKSKSILKALAEQDTLDRNAILMLLRAQEAAGFELDPETCKQLLRNYKSSSL